MFAAIGGWLLSQAIKFASNGVIQKALDFYNKSQDNTVRLKEIDAVTARAAMSAYVEHTKTMADLNKAKFEYPIYWIFTSLFIIPLGLWWTLVIADGIFYFPFDIADLPTLKMQEWAGQMITYLFYTGSTVIGLKALMR